MKHPIHILPPVATIKLSFIPTIPFHSTVLCSSAQIAEFLRSLYDKEIYQYSESFYAIYLNRANLIIGVTELSKGGITGTVVDIRTVLAIALSCAATSIIISHNHPSSSVKPSGADEKITARLKAAAALFDITLLDHIIITHQHYYSFADEGLL